eukprot:TRINITY_DN71867_c0_g1_i1.p1 TRINITY_DN71867_c0_g1~~TRINITY_DN71867_c0_g1_i1.p1  ORF type:complete len:126 (-),score=17.01 TRINITY_DN71867_c0_g1_i1:10-336(-)
MPVMIRERAVYYRERSTNMYSPWIYSISIGVVELPPIIFNNLIFLLPFYFMVGFRNDERAFFLHFLGQVLMSICFVYWEQLLSELMPNEIGRAVQQECRDRSRMPSSA